MKLLTVLLLLLLLLGMFSLSVAEVVHSFKRTCPQFFIKNKNRAVPPTVLQGVQYKQICQFYKEEYRFATLYDTIHRIPVYSAYTYNITKSTGQPFKPQGVYWKIEPQLDENQTVDNREMRRETEEEEEQILNQTLNKDYRNSCLNQPYTRGHVFPRSYAQSDQQKESTYTLTNAAPQIKYSNEEWARQVEEPMLNETKGNCDNKSLVYIVTGVVPGDVWLPIERGAETIDQGVNVPKYFWAAYSCKSKKNMFHSNGYIAQQIICRPNVTTKFKKRIVSIDKLNKELGKHYNNAQFRVFG